MLAVVIVDHGGPQQAAVVGGHAGDPDWRRPSDSIVCGLVYPGEFQFNVEIPPSLANGDQPITGNLFGRLRSEPDLDYKP